MDYQDQTLGRYLSEARAACGYSLQQLATISRIPKTTLVRLELDKVAAPRPEHLATLARHLELSTEAVLERAGIRLPQQVASLSALLRAEYDLSPTELREAHSQIEKIIRRHRDNRSRSDTKQKKEEL